MEPAQDQTFNALQPVNAVTVNRAGAFRAQDLIRSGHSNKSSSFTPPSAAEKDSYAKANPGMLDSWFLGVVVNNTPNPANGYDYPFSSDFKTVSREALLAARALANQRGDKEIAQAADKLLQIMDGNTIPLNSGVAGLSMKVAGSKGTVSYETVAASSA